MSDAAGSSPLVLSYKGLEPDDELFAWLNDGLVGGVVLFRDNATNEPQLEASIAAIRAQSPRPIYIMIDEEGGRVRRLQDSGDLMKDLRSYETELGQAHTAYEQVASRLQCLDIDTLLAPVVDIGDTGAEWLRSRTISDDPKVVAVMATRVIPAIQSSGVRACAKHFPGSGRVRLDPHLGVASSAITKSEWTAHEAIPFQAAIGVDVAMILVGHQEMAGFGKAIPACFSPDIVSGLLKSEMNYNGLILTDDLAMGAIASAFPIEEAVDRALSAGCDLALVCNDRALQRRAIEWWRGRVVV